MSFSKAEGIPRGIGTGSVSTDDGSERGSAVDMMSFATDRLRSYC